MGCKWCGADLDWRVENGKNMPYNQGTIQIHDCPKRPGTHLAPQLSQPPPPAGAHVQKPETPKDTSVIVGFMTVEMKNQLRAIVKEGVRDALKEIFSK